MKIGFILAMALAGCAATGPREGGAPGHAGVGRKSAQDLAPIEQIDTWLNALHVAKDNPQHVAEVNHYCDVVNDDLIQCALYDRSGPRAHLVGVEYVLSETAFERLPTNERDYWHPHNYEVLSGMLAAPGLSENREEALMRRMLNTYGKTWHTWPMGTVSGAAPSLPTGSPELAWSFNADGEAPAGLVQARDRRLDMDHLELRERRAELTKEARPQQGVNAMAKDFPNRRALKGVREIYPTDRQQEPGTR